MWKRWANMRAGIVVIAVILVFGLWPSTASPDPTETAVDSAAAAVREAVNVAWRDHIEAAKRKDLGAVMKIYADDVIYVVSGMQDVRGHPAVKKMEEQTLAEADVLNAVHTIESLNVFGDVAYEVGTVIGPIRQKGKASETVTFHFMALWRRQADGGWCIGYFVGQPE